MSKGTSQLREFVTPWSRDTLHSELGILGTVKRLVGGPLVPQFGQVHDDTYIPI